MNNALSYFEMEEAVEPNFHGIWVEKYRPKTIQDFIGSSHLKQTFENYITNKEIPHIMLYGPPGTGKTSLSFILVNNIPCDSLVINASDENKVDDIRYKVQDFAKTMGIHPLKIIFLDEADRMTPDAQGVMRNLMETYASHTRFILTCNYQEKLQPAIKSRCQCFEIKPPQKSDCGTKLIKILDSEGIKYSKEDLLFIVKSYFPDFRKIINFAQQSVLDGNLVLNKSDAIDSDYKESLVSLLKTHSEKDCFQKVRQLIADASFSNYDEVYKYLFDKVDEFAGNKSPQVILHLAEAIYQSSLVFEREITFVAAMYTIIQTLNNKNI